MENNIENEQQPITQPVDSKPATIGTAVTYFKKNKLIVIAIVAIMFLIIGGTLFNSMLRKIVKNNDTVTKNSAKEPLSGSVLLSPSTVVGTPGQKSSVDVMINTGGKKIAGVKVAITYNPQVIENVSLTPFKDKTSALAYSLEQQGEIINDSKIGEVMIVLKLPTGMQDLAGTGKIAELSFAVKPLKVALTSTDVTVTTLTGFLSSTEGEHTNITKNRLSVTLPAGVPFLSPTPIVK